MTRRAMLASLVGSVFARALPPIKPKSVFRTAPHVAQGIGVSIRMISRFDPDLGRMISRIDVLDGPKILRPEHSCVVLG